jgi:ABC-type nitrate/sulfonate/bicarbonate transport system substrate-binding protein
VAEDLGFFADQGIALDQIFFPSASEVIPALTRGDVDAAIVGVNPATLNALAGNFGIHVVADAGSQAAGFPANVLVVAKEMAGSVRSAADLRGKKVGLTPPGAGTASGFMLSKYLAQANLTLNDVDLVALNFPDQVAALSNHSVDAAMMTEPFATRTIQTGSGALLATGDQMAPGQQVVVMVYTDRFVNTQRDDGVRLMTAYLRGLRAYLAAFSSGDQRDRIIQILTSRTDIKDAQLWTAIYPTGANPDGTLNVQSMADSQTYFQGLGLVQTPADLSKVIDTSFTQAAVQALGPGPTPAPPKRS